jgi:hypothetical protein
MSEKAWRIYLFPMIVGIALPCASFAQSTSPTKAKTPPGYVFDCTDVSIDFKDNPSLTNEEKLRLMDQALSESLSRFDSCQQALQNMRNQAQQQPSAQSNTQGSSASSSSAESASGGGMAANQNSSGQGEQSTAEQSSSSADNSMKATNTAKNAQSGSMVESVPSSDMTGTERANAEGSDGNEAATNVGVQAGGSGAPQGRMQNFESVASSQMAGTDKVEPKAATTDAVAISNIPNANGGGAGNAASEALSNGKVPEDIPPADNDSILEAQIRQAAMNETDPETKAKLWNEYRKYKGLKPVK